MFQVLLPPPPPRGNDYFLRNNLASGFFIYCFFYKERAISSFSPIGIYKILGKQVTSLRINISCLFSFFAKLFFHFLKSFSCGINNRAVLQLLIFALLTASRVHLSFIACALLPVDLILFKLFYHLFN